MLHEAVQAMQVKKGIVMRKTYMHAAGYPQVRVLHLHVETTESAQ